MISRRHFLTDVLATASSAAAASFAISRTTPGVLADQPTGTSRSAEPEFPLAGEVGITTSSLTGHLARGLAPSDGRIGLQDLPRILREELDMRVIDLNTSTIAGLDRSGLEKFRTAAEKAGCRLTNLKLNQRGLDMSSPDRDVREKALAVYRRSFEDAEVLGLKWARPLPLQKHPDMRLHVDSWRKLCDHAEQHHIRMLVENYGWMESDPDSVAKLIREIDRNVAASPDTGNWSTNAVRYQGLKATFPLAVTCDFKARELTADGEHALYDLKKCFVIGRHAGFRGPWCLEHANRDRTILFRELALLRDKLRDWTREAEQADGRSR